MTKTKTKTGRFLLARIEVPVFVIAVVFIGLYCISQIYYSKFLWRRALRYDVQGRFAEAEPLLRRALVIMRKQLGAEHPTVAGGLMDHAAILRDLGRESEAAQMEARARRIGPAAPGRARRRRRQGSTLG